ncbi:MAG: relaxase/mobilization nuclease domain-containing protein [Alteromonadaceae bacterium]|nr:relaxase/mobilization nuclease domain-containing protein [Alteromonadaceae bacterium]
MARSNAVSAVTGELFRDGWSKISGAGAQARRNNQVTRAARGHSPAIFKPVKEGGCRTRSQLSGQLSYVGTKATHIIDSRGVYDGQGPLTSEQINDIVDRFSGSWNEGFSPKLGHTTHMIMAFPIGTKGEDVRDMASEVCEQFFMQDERQFDYIVAIHEDRAHPHAHVILNRRSAEGELFYLGKDHHFNYDDFRQAMVEAGERHGVRLEATRRVDRGVATYSPNKSEVYQAKEEGREPQARERIGPDLERALADIASTAELYRSLADEATAENREAVATALNRAAALLERGEPLKPDGEIYMAETQTFDELRSEFSNLATQAEARAETLAPDRRASFERELSEIYASVSRSETYQAAPTETGIYAENNINREALDRLGEADTRAQIESALEGTGISADAVVARVEAGANNEALERQWIADDLQRIAEHDGLDLSQPEDQQAAIDRLDAVHVQLGETLHNAEVLRDAGVTDDYEYVDDELPRPIDRDTSTFQLSSARAEGVETFSTAAAAGRAFAEADAADQPRIVESTEYGARTLARTVSVGDEIAKSAPTREAVETSSEFDARHDREFWNAYHDRLAEDVELTEDGDTASSTASVLAAMRQDSASDPFASASEREAYRAEIESRLTEDQIEDLRNGSDEALADVSDDRLDRLYAAKAYLQTDAATAEGEVMQEINNEIANEEIDAARLRHSARDTEKGQTHG